MSSARILEWCGPYCRLLTSSLVAGGGYLAMAALGANLDSGNPPVVSNAFTSAVAVAAIMQLGPRIAVTIGIAALAYGLGVYPTQGDPRNFSMLVGLATLCALHPLLSAWVATRCLMRIEQVTTLRALGCLMLAGPAVCLVAATAAGAVIMVFADMHAAQVLAILAKWWVVSSILIPITVAVMVALRSSARQSVMLSIEQMLPALGTAGFLIAMLVAVRHMQTSDELAKIEAQLRDAAAEDISRLATGAPWKGGLESLLAIQRYRFDLPAMNRYVDSVSSSEQGLVAIGWARKDGMPGQRTFPVTWAKLNEPGQQDIPSSYGSSPAAAAAVLEAVRTGAPQLLKDPDVEAGATRVAYTAFYPSYPLKLAVADMGPDQREAVALGVVVATYDLRKLFGRMQKLALSSGSQITVMSPDGKAVIRLGVVEPVLAMSDDVEARASVLAGDAAWMVKYRRRSEIASIADVRPSDIALSVISMLLGIGMAYATLDTIRRRREIESEVRRRTVTLARQVTIRQETEASLRNAQDQLKAVFSAIPIPTLLVDVDNAVILDGNESTQALTGLPAIDARGRALAELDLPSLAALSEAGMAAGEMELATPTGRRRYVVTSRCVQVEGRQAMLVCFGDVTRLHEVEAGLRSANEMLEIRVAARTAELDASRKQIRAAMDHSPIGLAMVDLEGRWFDVNDAICRILGYDREDLITLDVYQISHPDDVNITLDRVSTLLAGQADSCSLEKRYLRKDGLTVWVQLDMAAVCDELGKPMYFVAQIQDITDKRRKAEELHHAAEEMEKLNDALASERESLAARVAERTAELRRANEVLKLANEKANQASRAKSEFVAVMSHEIRTPLNGVIGALDMLQATQMRGDQQELVSMGFEAARSLLAIVDDILDFSRIETGAIRIDASEFAFEERLVASVECLLPMARRLNAQLTVWVDPSLPHRVLGDEMRVQQIVRNLVANALKFSSGLAHRGVVAVRASLVPTGERGQARVQISVRDNGIGMGADAMTRLFQPFTQADQSTTRRFGGSGLGLSICARLANLMGGRIDVTSQPDAGSTFTLDIPLTVATWAAEGRRLQGQVVQVLGEDVEFIDDIRATLQAAGACLVDDVHAENGVTVVDMSSTDDDPLQARLDANSKTGVLLLTRDGPRRGETVVPGVITLDRQVLGTRNLVDGVLMAAGHETRRPDTTHHREQRAVADRPLILLVEDNPMNQAVVQRQLEMLGFQVAVAPDGEAGLALWRQLRPALILTDLHMPVMDGYGMVQRILSGAGDATPPIIALTADANSEERDKCLAAGMSGYITKPVRAQALKIALDKWIAAGPVRYSGRDEGKRIGKALQHSILEEVAAGDPRLIEALLDMFVRLSGEVEGVLRTALVACDWDKLEEEAHKFKSSARTVGAVRLGDLCEALERVCNLRDMHLADGAVQQICAELERVLAENSERMEGNTDINGDETTSWKHAMQS